MDILQSLYFLVLVVGGNIGKDTISQLRMSKFLQGTWGCSPPSQVAGVGWVDVVDVRELVLFSDAPAANYIRLTNMCAQLVIYPQRRPIFSTILLGWLPVLYYTQHFPDGCHPYTCSYNTPSHSTVAYHPSMSDLKKIETKVESYQDNPHVCTNRICLLSTRGLVNPSASISFVLQ